MDTIKTFRKCNKMSQVALAEYLKVTQGFVSQMEKEVCPIPDWVISKILENPYGWDVTMLTSDQPENPVEEQPEERSIVDKLFTLLAEEQKSNKILLELLREKDEKIEALQEEIRHYREHKGETAKDAATSFAANAV